MSLSTAIPNTQSTPITEQALLKRINRKLAHDDERVHKAREQWVHELGEYYLVDYGGTASSNVLAYHVDIENMGREIGVLRENEEVTCS